MDGNQDERSLRVLVVRDGMALFVTGGMQQYSALLVKYLAPLFGHITLMHFCITNWVIPSSEDVCVAIGNPLNLRVLDVPVEERSRVPGHFVRASKRLSDVIE